MIQIIIYLFFLAIIWALIETEIEGSSGWAANLPTWKINIPFKKVLNGKCISGYHVYMFIMFLIIFHGYFLFNPWSFGHELICIGTLLIFLIVEDFLWFILNPYYETAKFFQQKVRWHKKWFLRLPVDYWIMILTGTYLILIGGRL